MHRTIFHTPVVNTVLRALSLLYLRFTGWKVEGSLPQNASKCVLIAAPHTSNWDLPYTLMVAFALNLQVYWMGKQSIFKRPFGAVMRWLGGIPVDRSGKSDVVTQTVEAIERSERIIIVIAPEGTRKHTTRWRSGFYWIAQKANVPILPVAFDFSRKEVRLFPLFHPTGDQAADVAKIRSLYTPEMGRFPAQFARPSE